MAIKIAIYKDMELLSSGWGRESEPTRADTLTDILSRFDRKSLNSKCKIFFPGGCSLS